MLDFLNHQNEELNIDNPNQESRKSSGRSSLDHSFNNANSAGLGSGSLFVTHNNSQDINYIDKEISDESNHEEEEADQESN